MSRRCPACPIPRHLPCRGEVLRHACGDPRYRAYFARLAESGRTPAAPIAAPPVEPPPHLRCPHARRLRRAKATCRDVYCLVSDRVVCKLSDCPACPLPAGRLLPAPAPVSPHR